MTETYVVEDVTPVMGTEDGYEQFLSLEGYSSS